LHGRAFLTGLVNDENVIQLEARRSDPSSAR